MSTTKERGVLFRDDDVRAILADRKSSFRRPVNPQPPLRVNPVSGFAFCLGDHPRSDDCERDIELINPFGEPGDLLYAREAWGGVHLPDEPGDNVYRGIFRADREEQPTSGKWHPSVHMPKWLARIWLRVVDLRVERLREMSGDDAWLEGFREHDEGALLEQESLDSFRLAWDSHYAAKGLGWAIDPWVWVCNFERVEKPTKIV